MHIPSQSLDAPSAPSQETWTRYLEFETVFFTSPWGIENDGKALGSPCAVGYKHTLVRVRVAKSVWQNQKIHLRVGNQLFRRNMLPGSTWLPGALPLEISPQE